MLTEERQQLIIELLKQQEVVKMKALCQLLKTSESTVRRDLQLLEEQGLLIRIHGGAKRINTLQEELGQIEKTSKNVHEKTGIAQLAASKIKTGCVIYLDAGTTTQAIIPYLTPAMNLTVVTNGVDTASLLADHQIQTFLLGGRVKNKTKAMVGAAALEALLQFQFNQAILGTNGIDLAAGLTTPDLEEATLKRFAIQQANQTLVLADHTKFEAVSFSKFAQLEQVQLITDQLPATIRQRYQQQANIQEVLS
ncbi:DeoR/GlpR family DNA-binding transcription regulator [Latilactobacillus fuchuensis]|uniref:Transcriptional regulator (DeoR family) n=1 Tax=Latilactobacillus fuchuensis TaxID=164393 RepID=A0A2N9DVR1_9LACO|nr:DeoR/GlpR family DNA-binding transcription regulator [Latilactobacillus fuchuensis]SPC38581.1 transcriptional regulator (DeoR family) [Latilactobacillus fuchuensis]